MDDQTGFEEEEGPQVEPHEVVPTLPLSKTALAVTREARERKNGNGKPTYIIPDKADGTRPHVFHRLGACRVTEGEEVTKEAAEARGLKPCPNCLREPEPEDWVVKQARSSALKAAWLAGEDIALQDARERFGVSDNQFYEVKKKLKKDGYVFKQVWTDRSRCVWTIVPANEGVVATAPSAPDAPPRASGVAFKIPPIGTLVRIVGLRWSPENTVEIDLQGDDGLWTCRAEKEGEQ